MKEWKWDFCCYYEGFSKNSFVNLSKDQYNRRLPNVDTRVLWESNKKVLKYIFLKDKK